MAIKYITVLERQSVWDLAVQEYGSSEGVYQLILDNPELNFEVTPTPGTKIKIDDTKILNKDTVNYFKEKGVKPANDSLWINSALLMEDGFFILNEDGTKLIIDE